MILRSLVEQNFDDNTQPFFNASIGNQRQRTESAKKEPCFMSGTTATLSIIVHRKCCCCISEQQSSMVSVDFKHCSSSGSLRHLSSTLTEQFRGCFPRPRIHVRQFPEVARQWTHVPAGVKPTTTMSISCRKELDVDTFLHSVPTQR